MKNLTTFVTVEVLKKCQGVTETVGRMRDPLTGGRRLRNTRAGTTMLRNSIFPEAVRLLTSFPLSTVSIFIYYFKLIKLKEDFFRLLLTPFIVIFVV